MMDIEGHTSIYLGEILASKASLDPEITGFLHVWAYEEMFHSLALRRFLRSYGVDIPDSRPATVRAGDNSGRVKTTLAILVGSHLFDFFPAVYLCVGAINELTTLWAYQQLVARTGHPVLEELLRRIVLQERRHYAYYRWQAAHQAADPPGPDALVDAQHGSLAIDEGDVERKPHEEHVDRVARGDGESMPRGQLASEHQS